MGVVCTCTCTCTCRNILVLASIASIWSTMCACCDQHSLWGYLHKHHRHSPDREYFGTLQCGQNTFISWALSVFGVKDHFGLHWKQLFTYSVDICVENAIGISCESCVALWAFVSYYNCCAGILSVCTLTSKVQLIESMISLIEGKLIMTNMIRPTPCWWCWLVSYWAIWRLWNSFGTQ